jgi:phage terminase large subunit
MKLARTYYDAKTCNKRIQVHQGGTRSGKTYSLLLVLIELAYKNPNAGATITIARKTFPALRASVMRDFFEILNRENIYNEAHHNKSDATYILFGNLVEFISIDQAQKVRGRKRDVLFINEANELSLEDWRQLLIRTTGNILLDYNPSDEFHWLYEQVIPREDAAFFKTTYLDNPFLDAALVAEIERLKDADENFWRVYGLGERGQSRSTIFNHYIQTEDVGPDWKLLAYGLDFGYTNDPTAAVAVYTNGNQLLFDEVLYQSGLANRQIAKLLDVGKAPIIADSAEPKSIDELHGYGLNVHAARKGPDSVRSGIQYLHSKPLYITARSVNLLKELRNYKWREDKNGRILNEPVDAFNHAIDAARYAATFNLSNPNFGRYRIG